MDCAAYANQCFEPERLVYHCVINTFVNQILEVCAYAQNILQGLCTEFNIRGNIIQPNVRANCTVFAQNPCPQLYNSNEAHKYKGCYELTRERSANSQQRDSTTEKNDEKSSFKMSDGNMSVNENIGNSNPGVKIIVFSVYAMILSVVAVAAVYLYWKRRSH